MKLQSIKDHPEYIEEAIEQAAAYLYEQEEEKGSLNREKLFEQARQDLQELIEDDNRQFFLFTKGKNVIGFAECDLIEEAQTDEDPPEATLKVVSFYIAPPFRRQKLGSHFFNVLREWAKPKATLLEMEVPGFHVGEKAFLEGMGLELVDLGPPNLWRGFIQK